MLFSQLKRANRLLEMLLVFQELIRSSCLRPDPEGRAQFCPLSLLTISPSPPNWQELGVLHLSLWGGKLIPFCFSDVSSTTPSRGHFRSPPNGYVLRLHKGGPLGIGNESILHGDL